MTLIVVFASGVAADLSTKAWSFHNVAGAPVVLDRATLVNDHAHDPVRPHRGRPLLPGRLLECRLVLNAGAVFGIGANQRWFFIVFTVGALSAGLVVFAISTRPTDRLAHVAIGLILAGGLGNLYDRIAFGRVRDFLRMLPDRQLPLGWTWPGTSNHDLLPWVFNLADTLLFVGMILLLVHLNRVDKRRKMEQQQVAGDPVPATVSPDP